MVDPVIFAAVEGGGTSFVVAVARQVDNDIPRVLHRHEVDSSHDQPSDTLAECADFLRKHKPTSGYHALGVATFGPVGLNPSLASYGHILGSSPKQSWRNVDILTPLAEACRGSRALRINVETDVNAPAIVEYLREKDTLSSVAYVTVGTGVGVGLVINGKPVHGRMHPEGGHVPIQPLDGDKFVGYSWGEKSPFCGRRTVEGITSSVALTERLEQMTSEKSLPRSRLVELSDDHEIWDHAANALANLCVILLLTTSIEKIVFGGGIMNRIGLLEKIQKRTLVLMNGYLELPDDMSQLITQSPYGNSVGLVGALVLARSAYEDTKDKKENVATGALENRLPFYHGVVVGALMALVAMTAMTRQHQRVR